MNTAGNTVSETAPVFAQLLGEPPQRGVVIAAVVQQRCSRWVRRSSVVAVFVNGNGVKAVMDATGCTTAKNLVAAVILIVLASFGRHVHSRTGQATGDDVEVLGSSIPFVMFFEGPDLW